MCGAFIQTLGSLGSGVSEGVTNPSPGTGINYANHHLAMGQMTPIVSKTYLSGSSRCDRGEPFLPERPARGRADLVLVLVLVAAASHSLHCRRLHLAKFSLSISTLDRSPLSGGEKVCAPGLPGSGCWDP